MKQLDDEAELDRIEIAAGRPSALEIFEFEQLKDSLSKAKNQQEADEIRRKIANHKVTKFKDFKQSQKIS